MKKTFFLFLVLSFITLAFLYYYETNNQQEPQISEKLLPSNDTYIDENDPLNDYPEAEYSKNYFTNVHYSIDEYYDRTCPEQAAASYIHVNITYPQIHLTGNEKVANLINAKFNKLSLIDKLESRTTYDINATVVYFKKNFVSILFEGNQMNCDDSHNYTWFDTLNVNIKNGHQYKLEELFDTKTLSQLHRKIEEHLRAKFPNTDIKDFSLDKEDLFKNFTISDESVTIYFSMYQIGAASYGSMKITLPLKDLAVKAINQHIYYSPIK